MMPPPTGRHDASKGTYITCGIVLLIAILLVIWAMWRNPFAPDPQTPPTPIPVVIVTPDTQPPPVPTLVVPTMPAGVPTAPAPVPTGVPTRVLLNAVAQHDGTTPLFGPPCWSNSRRNPATCTPTITPFPPGSPTVTAVPTDTPTAIATATGTAVPTGTPSVTPTVCPHNTYWACVTPREFAAETARLINVHRQTVHGYGLFTLRADLSRAEELHAIKMIGDPANNDDDRCEHGDYGGRAAAQGYQGFAWGNIGACGYDTPASTVQGWVDSPGHHFIMDAWDMTEFGVGAAQYANGYWQAWSTIGCGHDIPCLQP